METIKGYLQEQPEMRFVPSGIPITTLRISTNKAEEDVKKYVRINAWEGLAEVANQLLQMNDFIYIKGYWKTRSWEGTDKQQHSAKELTAKQIWDKDFKDIMELTDLPMEENNG